MNKLLAYYQKELNFLKQHGKIFASRFPKIARRLGIVEGESEDPHVSRLVESFALLTSRIHQRLDDDMPEVVEALISALAPQFLRTLPSVCIVLLSPDPLKSGLTGKNVLPAGTSLLTRQASPQPCQFQTIYPVTLLPLSVSNALLHFNSDELSWQLQLRFQVWPGAAIGDERIRLYLHGPDNIVSILYTLLCSEISSLSLYQGETSISLTAETFQPVGFETGEALLTREPRIAPVHILLLDYFWFPQKFAFIDIKLPPGFKASAQSDFELQARFHQNHLTERLEKLAPLIDEHFFRLHCTPAINLFTQRAEPIVLTDATAEYPVIPDNRFQTHIVPWAIQQVSVQRKINNNLESFQISQLLEGGVFDNNESKTELLWQSFYRSNPGGSNELQFFIAFCERHQRPVMKEADIATLTLLCSNGERAHQLQYGNSSGDFDIEAPVAGLKIVALTHPTHPINPPDRNISRWRFLSHLSLNYQLLSGEHGAQRLIDILSLYNFNDTPGKNQLFTLIKRLECEPITARIISNDPHSLARGVSLTLTFDQGARLDSEYFLLCNLLDRLLALHAPVNSFTRLTTCIEHSPQTLRVWPIRAGRLSWL